MPRKKILVLAPHNDDETLGCGATIAKHVYHKDEVFVATLTSIQKGHPVLKSNLRIIREETKKAMAILGVKQDHIFFCDLPNVLLDDIAVHAVNKVVSDLVNAIEPHTLYLPFIYNLHKDHHAIAYAAQVAARTCTDIGRKIKEVYMYETLSETHWNIDSVEGAFVPNVYNDVTRFMRKKLDAVRAYKSQLKTVPYGRCIKGLDAMASFRGALAGMRKAEAFVMVRYLK